MTDFPRKVEDEEDSVPATVFLEHGYWPTPSTRKKLRVPYLVVWVKEDSDPEFPWESLPKALWESLEFWARAAGGIVKLFFGLTKPTISVTFHTYASERAFDAAYSFADRPHWDWCDDTGNFDFTIDEKGRAVVQSWFPDDPSESKQYFLAWDESRNGYWRSNLDECTYQLDEGIDCSIPEAINLSELFLEYEPWTQEKVTQRDQRLADKQAFHDRHELIRNNQNRPSWNQRAVPTF